MKQQYYIIFNCPLCLKKRQEILERELGSWITSGADRQMPNDYHIMCTGCNKKVVVPELLTIVTQKWITGEKHPITQEIMDPNTSREELCEIFESSYRDKNGLILMVPHSGWKHISDYVEKKR